MAPRRVTPAIVTGLLPGQVGAAGDLTSLSNQLLDAASFLEFTDPPLMGDNTEDDVQTIKLTAFLLREMDRRMGLEGEA